MLPGLWNDNLATGDRPLQGMLALARTFVAGYRG